MFKALLTTLAITFAISAFAADISGPDPADWYIPKDYTPPLAYNATAEVVDARGKIHDVEFEIMYDADGNVMGSTLQDALKGKQLSIQSAISLIDAAMMDVANNAIKIDIIYAMIETLGENLTKVFMTKGLSIEIGDKDKSYTLKIKEGALKEAVQSGTTITHIDEDGLFHVPDEKSISRLPDGQTELKGFGDTSQDIEGATLTRLLTAGNEEKNRREIMIPVRRKRGEGIVELKYLKIGDVLAEAAPPDGESIVVWVDGENSSVTNTALYGWHNDNMDLNKLADLMTKDPKASEGNTTFAVLAKRTDGDDNTLAYLPLGNLYGVTWATNWTEAVKHITTEETIKIVNWTTNWVNHTQYVTNYEDIVRITTNLVYHENFVTNIFNHENFVTNLFVHENFVTNVFNHENFVTNAITQLHTIENWQVVTNYIVRYMGGGTSGGDNSTPPPIDPKNDPYHEDYEEQKGDENILPLRNARHIVAISNEFFKVVSTEGALDGASLWTNDAARAEIAGFWQAKTNQTPVKVKLEQPKTDRDGNPIQYGIEWMDYPAALVAITSKDIEKIQKWLEVMKTENIFTLVASNTEKVAILQTSPYSVINANALLDNASIWTNNNHLAEVKGFQHAPYGTIPVKSTGAGGDELKWGHPATPDSENMVDVGQGGVAYYNRSLVKQDGYGAVGTSNVWSLCGFENAKEREVPFAHTDEFGNKELKWGLTGNAVRVIGTDGSEAVIGEASRTNTLTFASAADSNVKVAVVGDGAGNVTVTFGVYYLQESNLNGGSGGGSGL